MEQQLGLGAGEGCVGSSRCCCGVRERRGENRSMPLGTGGQGGIFFTLVSFPSP
jgi:hypothetical protein